MLADELCRHLMRTFCLPATCLWPMLTCMLHFAGLPLLTNNHVHAARQVRRNRVCKSGALPATQCCTSRCLPVLPGACTVLRCLLACYLQCLFPLCNVPSAPFWSPRNMRYGYQIFGLRLFGSATCPCDSLSCAPAPHLHAMQACPALPSFSLTL